MPHTRAMLDRASLEEASLDRLQAEARRYRLPVGGERSELIDRILSHIETIEAQGMMAETPSAPSSGPSVEGEIAGGLEEPLTVSALRSVLNEMTDLMRQQQQSMQMMLQLMTNQSGGPSRQCAIAPCGDGVGSLICSNSEWGNTICEEYR